MTRCILFDFDYTLVDSSVPVVECANYALTQMGFPPAPYAAVCQTIGLSLEGTFYELSGRSDRQLAERYCQLFTEKANLVMTERTTLFAGTAQVLRALKAKGMLLGIVSNKFRYRITAILEKEGLSALFDVIVGSEDVQKPKPDPAGVLHALSTLGVARTECVYVGDSITDWDTARQAGVDFVAVVSGTTSKEAFVARGTNRVIDNLTALALPSQWS